MLSPNWGERRGGAVPRLIVIHYTGMASCAAARERLCDPAAEVSAHWLVDEAGYAEPLVDEAARAWHAGAGAWGSVSDVNSASIGIELANPGDAPFPARQMAGLERLLADVMGRWRIPSHGVIGHSDMAPGRKRDPGPRFDWRGLARAGLSVWPEWGDADPAGFHAFARAFGYPDVADDLLLAAFRLRFRPWARGPLDRTDAGMAADLARRFPVDALAAQA
jgi:N-acetylmuramoyl-L-alanine amidase